MKRPSKKDIKAKLDALKGETEKTDGPNREPSSKGKLAAQHKSQRIRKKGAS